MLKQNLVMYLATTSTYEVLLYMDLSAQDLSKGTGTWLLYHIPTKCTHKCAHGITQMVVLS